MPRVTRNFWLHGQVEGRKQAIAAGPSSANGGFELVVKMREKGEISGKELVVKGYERDGKLVLAVWTEDNGVHRPLGKLETER